MKKNRRQKGMGVDGILEYLAEVDRELGEDLPGPGKAGAPLSSLERDRFYQKMLADERAFLNPEEWGIDMRPSFREQINPPTSPDELTDEQVTETLRRMIDLLARYHLCLLSTNHLCDRELYQLIIEKIIPEPLGLGPDAIGGILYHECCPCDAEEWYQFYADEFEREEYASMFDEPLPEKKALVSDRDDWIEPLVESYRMKPLPVQSAGCD